MLGNFPIVANIPVTDLDTARTFYTDQLGLKLEMEVEGEALYFLCGEDTRLEVYRTRAAIGVGHTEAGFHVTGIEDVVATLQSRGVSFQEYDLGDGMKTVDGILTVGEAKVAWLTDPEGNVIGLFQPDGVA